MAITAQSQFARLFTPSLHLLYGPTLLYLSLRLAELSLTLPALTVLLPVLTNNIKTIAKLPDNSITDQWEKVLYSVVASTLEIFNKNSALVDSVLSFPLLELLFALLAEIPYKSDSYTNVHIRVTELLQKALISNDMKVIRYL